MVFLREPRLGHVKTRLARHLEENLVLDLYQAFVLDTLETVADCGPQALIFVEPPSGTATVARWLGDRFACIWPRGEWPWRTDGQRFYLRILARISACGPHRQ